MASRTISAPTPRPVPGPIRAQVREVRRSPDRPVAARSQPCPRRAAADGHRLRDEIVDQFARASRPSAAWMLRPRYDPGMVGHPRLVAIDPPGDRQDTARADERRLASQVMPRRVGERCEIRDRVCWMVRAAVARGRQDRRARNARWCRRRRLSRALVTAECSARVRARRCCAWRRRPARPARRARKRGPSDRHAAKPRRYQSVRTSAAAARPDDASTPESGAAGCQCAPLYSPGDVMPALRVTMSNQSLAGNVDPVSHAEPFQQREREPSACRGRTTAACACPRSSCPVSNPSSIRPRCTCRPT